LNKVVDPAAGSYYIEHLTDSLIQAAWELFLQIDEMGIEHGYDVDRILWLGKQMEKTCGTRLRSEAAINGRTLKEGHMQYARPGLAALKEKLGEKPDQSFPK
jgi:hydroxymethylglutaryl-CoA lyase